MLIGILCRHFPVLILFGQPELFWQNQIRPYQHERLPVRNQRKGLPDSRTGSGSFRIYDLVFHIRKGRQVFAEHFLLIICNNDETPVRILPEQMEQHGQILYRKQCFRLVLCQMPQSCAFPSGLDYDVFHGFSSSKNAENISGNKKS